MKKSLVGLVLLLTSSATWSQNDPAFTARYQVEFIADWSADTHPVGFPGNPHFSGLIGATHNQEVKLWQAGELATPGIRSMAETGSKSTLISEINALINTQQAQTLISGGGIATSPGFVGSEFEITSANPLVSLVSMMAPSPDWFVGVNSLNLRNNSQWQQRVVVNLHAYDAGTDSGASYTSSNQESIPKQLIQQITDVPFDSNPILGQFVFELIETRDNFPLSGRHSGLYFIPQNSGDGINVTVSESDSRNFVLITWYTYRNGEQMWLVGSTEYAAGDTSATIELFRTTGADFGIDFNSGDVESIPWGNLTLSFPRCGLMDVDFAGVEDATENGSLMYSLLAHVGVFDCH